MYSPHCLSRLCWYFGSWFGMLNLLTEALCFLLAVDNLLRKLPAEVSKDDTEDLHEIPGVPHPAERGSGSQGRTAQPTSLDHSAVLRLKLCQCSLGKNTLGDSCCQDVCPAAQSRGSREGLNRSSVLLAWLCSLFPQGMMQIQLFPGPTDWCLNFRGGGRARLPFAETG